MVKIKFKDELNVFRVNCTELRTSTTLAFIEKNNFENLFIESLRKCLLCHLKIIGKITSRFYKTFTSEKWRLQSPRSHYCHKLKFHICSIY